MGMENSVEETEALTAIEHGATAVHYHTFSYQFISFAGAIKCNKILQPYKHLSDKVMKNKRKGSLKWQNSFLSHSNGFLYCVQMVPYMLQAELCHRK